MKNERGSLVLSLLSVARSSPCLPSPSPPLPLLKLLPLLLFSFPNGLLLCTYFLLTLPLESYRMSPPLKSVCLAAFIAISGLTQLMCPAVGWWSDRCTHPRGRRTPFMALGGLAGTASLLLQSYASRREMWALYAAAFTVSMMSLNVIYTSMVGLIPDVVPACQTGAANGLQSLLAVLGALAGFGVYEAAEARGGEGEGLRALYSAYALAVPASIIVTCCAVREERPEVGRGEERRMFAKPDWGSLKSSYTLDLSSDFGLVTLSRTWYYMGVSSQAFFLYYLKDVARMSDPQTGVIIMSSVAQLGAALASVPVGGLSDRCGRGRKPWIYASCLVLGLGNVGFMFCRSASSVAAISAAIGVGNGGYLAMDSSLAVDTLPDRAEAAKYLGVWGVASFVGTALGPVVGGPALYFVGGGGREGREPGTYDVRGYVALLGASVVYFACAAKVLRGVKAR